MTTPLEIAMAIGSDNRYTLDLLSSKPYSMAIIDKKIDPNLRFVLTESSQSYYSTPFVYMLKGNTIFEFTKAYGAPGNYIKDVKQFMEWVEKNAKEQLKVCESELKRFDENAVKYVKQRNCKTMIGSYPERLFLAKINIDSWSRDRNPQQMYMYANGQFNLLDMSSSTPMFVRYADGRRFKTYDASRSVIAKGVYADLLK